MSNIFWWTNWSRKICFTFPSIALWDYGFHLMGTTEQMICDKLDCFLVSIRQNKPLQSFILAWAVSFSVILKLCSGLPSPTQASFIVTRPVCRNSLKMAWHFCVPQKSSTMKHHRIFIHFYFKDGRTSVLSLLSGKTDLRWVGSSLCDVLVSLSSSGEGWRCSSKKAFWTLTVLWLKISDLLHFDSLRRPNPVWWTSSSCS